MANKKEIIIPTTLGEIINFCTKRKSDFIDLDLFQKQKVLSFIKINSIDCKVFEVRGYDILKQRFFAKECSLGENTSYGYESNIVEFKTFNEYYDYLRGDIFDNACYFGYSFTEDDLARIGKTKRRLNKISYYRDVIENYSFEQLKISSIKKNSNALKRNQGMREWLDSCPPINSYDALLTQLSKFQKKYRGYDNSKIFFLYMIKKNGKKIENAVVKFASTHRSDYGLSFEDVLLFFGNDAAKSVINNYDAYTVATNKKYKRKFKKIVESLSNSTDIVSKTRGDFISLSQTFQVRKWFYKQGECFLFNSWDFLSFEDMASFLNNDLSNCDLTDADISNIDFSKYKTNEKTRLPRQNTYSSYKVLKGYDKDGFYVRQCWLDADNNKIQQKIHRFLYFCDFFYFLHGDLSNSDMIMCDGIENIKAISNVNYEGIKVRSDVVQKLGLKIDYLPLKFISTESFPLTEKYELETINAYLEKHFESDDYTKEVTYVTDIHLIHRFMANHCQTKEDCTYVIRNIIENIYTQSSDINLLGGDLTSDLSLFEYFTYALAKRIGGKTFITLGNHELWGFKGTKFQEIVAYYRNILSQKGLFLVQNNLFLFTSKGVKEITESQLKIISSNELRDLSRDASLIIFGGIGFAGKNNEFNANNGIYRNTINRQQEIELSEEFELLYDKVANILLDKNVIVFTHMPMQDWTKSNNRVKGFVYVSGHNHCNYYFDDGNQRIYSDNQIGYKQKEVSLKHLSINFGYDWFSEYKDGIFKISKKDYEYFYRGIGERLTFNREYQNLYMLKKEGVYMFLMTTSKGNLLLLNGGAIKNVGDHSIEYFFENLGNYSKSIRMFLSKYDEYQKVISKEIKHMGGSGTIHGSIVDIDFYNHLYLNPLDGNIVPYFASSMVDKYVYENVPSLLKNECPQIYDNYVKLIETKSRGTLVRINESLPVTSKKTYVGDTEMYKISRILRGLQFTIKYNVVRLWNDTIVADSSEENGRLLVSGIIHPEEMGTYHIEMKKKRKS